MSVGPGGPFCVGAAPVNNPPAFTGILATKPTKAEMANMKAALLTVPGASGEPLIQLILDGKATVTLSGEWAAFEKVRELICCCRRAHVGLRACLAPPESVSYLWASARAACVQR